MQQCIYEVNEAFKDEYNIYKERQCHLTPQLRVVFFVLLNISQQLVFINTVLVGYSAVASSEVGIS